MLGCCRSRVEKPDFSYPRSGHLRWDLFPINPITEAEIAAGVAGAPEAIGRRVNQEVIAVAKQAAEGALW